METRYAFRTIAFPLGLALSMATATGQADVWMNTNTQTNTYTNTLLNTQTNTNTQNDTNTRTCTIDGVPVDCDTGQPLPASVTNPAVNCPERRFEIIYGYYCDHRITTLRFKPVKIRHAYGGAGFNGGTGLTEAYGMNDNGSVVGQAITSGGEKHAVQLDIGSYSFENHYFSDLGTPRLQSTATAISNEYTVVGASQPSIGATNSIDAVWHSQLGGFTLLNALGGDSGTAMDLARNSMYTEFVAGYGIWPTSKGGDNREHGFVWSFDGRNQTVEVIGSVGQTNRVFAINDTKTAVGYQYQDGVKNASRWQNGVLTALPDYGAYVSVALDINNNVNTKIVGYASDSTGTRHATLWQNGQPVPLPALPNRRFNMATAISDGGDIVGQSGARAVLWRDGQVHDLNKLLDAPLSTTLAKAIDINRQGRVLVKGADGWFYVLIPTESL